MENNIPTAEEIFLQYNAHGFDCKCGCQDGGHRVRGAMLAFAKLHVKAAIEKIANQFSNHEDEMYSTDEIHARVALAYPENLIV